jgi:hypothetical protein
MGRISGTVGLAFLSALLGPGVASAQEKSERAAANAEVLLNPLGLVFGLYNLEAGIGVGDSSSLNFMASYASVELGDSDVTSYSGGVGIQFFPKGKLYHGWFIYPHFSVGRAQATQEELEAEATVVGIGVLGGYQWDWRPFTLRLGLGLGYYLGSASGDDINVGINTLAPLLDASLGFTF